MKQADITIRSAQKEDVPGMQFLLKEAGIYFAPVDDNPGVYEKQLEYDPESIVVAEHDKTIVGMILFVYSPLWTPVAHLAVLPRYRRKGIATLLFKEVTERVKKRGTCDAAGYIEETNKTSLAVCDALGFETHPARLICRYADFTKD